MSNFVLFLLIIFLCFFIAFLISVPLFIYPSIKNRSKENAGDKNQSEWLKENKYELVKYEGSAKYLQLKLGNSENPYPDYGTVYAIHRNGILQYYDIEGKSDFLKGLRHFFNYDKDIYYKSYYGCFDEFGDRIKYFHLFGYKNESDARFVLDYVKNYDKQQKEKAKEKLIKNIVCEDKNKLSMTVIA